MSTSNAAENYLIKALQITFQKEDDGIALIIYFNDDKDKEFLSPDGFMAVADFFRDRAIVLSVHKRAIRYRSSFIDRETADAINLDLILWGKDILKEFLETVDMNTKMRLYIAIIDRVQNRLIPHPLSAQNPMYVEGYVVKEIDFDA